MKFAAYTLTAAFLMSTTAFAQTAESNRTINERKADQQARIRQGDRSGELTRGESRHLEGQEHAINREERNMRAQDNGRLTKQDRKTIASQQNQESRRIYRDKHNSNVQ